MGETQIKNTDIDKIDITTFVSEKLADIVVLNRYLGLYNDLAKSAMEELATRRINGDSFEYEKYIDENTQKMPKVEFNIPKSSIYDILKPLIKI